MTSLFPIELRGATASRRGKRLVGPVDLRLEQAGVCIVIGPNGSGKTTLLRLMHGAARLSKGQIIWGCDTALARQRQAFVFQRPVMLRRSVMGNLVYPLRLRGVSKSQAEAKARQLATQVGIEAFLDRPATVLSGGEQQKLAIARALITSPELLFLDEPTASLDGRATREIETILSAAKHAGTQIIMSTHDMGQAKRLADRVVFMLGGAVHEEAAADPFFRGPQTAEASGFLQGDIIE